MEPIPFKESNRMLTKPEGLSHEECGSLPAFTNGEVCITKHKMSFRERLHCLFKGYIWLHILSGSTQPPISIQAYKSAFER